MCQPNRLKLSFYRVTLLLSSLVVASSVSRSDNPRVSLTLGCVEGQVKTTVLGRNYFSFQGIPYAAPPIGRLRFKAPQPPVPWSGVLKATKEPPACLQPWRQNPMPIYFSEDCLFLNVFTPYLKHPSGKAMPVIFWIHGGKFYQSSGSTYKYGPDFLFMKDIVLVVINYRLGIFGYLNLNISEAQGNAAMKDKVAALRWVQQEIGKFGGDPSRVTIMGGSSGASDVAHLYMSPLAKGLFHTAISQSGAALCYFAFMPSTVSLALQVAASLDCPTLNPQEVVACLRDVHGSVLAEQQMVVGGTEGVELPFLPSLETDHGEEVFLPDTPQNLISQSGGVPYFIGLNDGEGLMYMNDLKEHDLLNIKEAIVSYLPVHLTKNVSNTALQEMTATIADGYFEQNPSINHSLYGYVNFMTDKQFGFCILKTVEALKARAPVYLYYFTFKGEFKLVHSYDHLNMTGVGHGDELGYLFYRNFSVEAHNNFSAYPREMDMVKKAVTLWTNFATYGNPTPKHGSEMNITWEPAPTTINSYLIIDETLQMVNDSLLKEREAIWDALYQIFFHQYTPWKEEEGHFTIYTVVCLVGIFILIVAVAHYIKFRQERSLYYEV